jgi:hypothetical protein
MKKVVIEVVAALLFFGGLQLAISTESGPLFVVALTMVTIGLIVFVLGFFVGGGLLSALSGQNSRAFKDAAIGMGTVQSVSQTGTYINEQPQVRIDLSVETIEGKTFQSQAKLVVPLTELGLLRPGVVLPVRYLPDRLDRVELDRSDDQAAAQEVYNQSMIRKGLTTPEMVAVARQGVRAQGVVRNMTVPGDVRHDWTRVVLDVAVTRPDGSMFTTETSKFIAPNEIGNIQVGKVLDVRYMPDNESVIAFSRPANQT